jgi:hypothetical protein
LIPKSVRGAIERKYPRSSSIWLVLSIAGAALRLFRWMARRPVDTLISEPLRAGESITITSVAPAPAPRRRRKQHA